MSVDSINSVGSPYAPLNANQASMASGKQINTAADNPAGLAIVNSMTTQIMQQSIGVRNANDGMALLQTANGAAQGMTQGMQRMYELSLQAMNGTMNPSQRAALNVEFQQNLQELNRTAETTKFNGMALFTGEYSNLKLALGESEAELTLPTLTGNALGLNRININDSDTAGSAMESLLNAMNLMNETQAQFGAQQNGLYSAVSNMLTQQQNTLGSQSQILDTNYAEAASNQARQDVLLQAGIMMQSHRNQDQGNVLQLLS